MFKKFVLSFLSVLLVVCTLSTCAFGVLAADTSTKKYDIVFVLETSNSMSKNWQTIIKTIGKTVKSLDEQKIDYRVGIVLFKTNRINTIDYKYKSYGYMKGYDDVMKYLDGVTLHKSDFTDTCLFSALCDIPNTLNPRHDAVRGVFVIGKTYCANPETNTGVLYTAVQNKLSLDSKNPANSAYIFYTYNLGDDKNAENYQALAKDSRGNYNRIDNNSTGFESLLSTAFSKDIKSFLSSTPVVQQETFIEKLQKALEKMTDTTLKPIFKMFITLYKMMFKK